MFINFWHLFHSRHSDNLLYQCSLLYQFEYQCLSVQRHKNHDRCPIHDRSMSTLPKFAGQGLLCHGHNSSIESRSVPNRGDNRDTNVSPWDAKMGNDWGVESCRDRSLVSVTNIAPIQFAFNDLLVVKSSIWVFFVINAPGMSELAEWQTHDYPVGEGNQFIQRLVCGDLVGFGWIYIVVLNGIY